MKIAIKERDFQQSVVDLAKLCGWSVFHPYHMQRSAPGWPDLVLVRDCVLYRELKTEKGKLTEAQKGWLLALEQAGADARVWRPSDFDEIEAVLKGERS